MDQGILTKLIKENSKNLRQLTFLNNEIKQLKKRVRKLEKVKDEMLSSIEMSQRRGFEVISGLDMSKKEIANIKVGGTDPD